MYQQQEITPVLAHGLKDEALMHVVSIVNKGAVIPVTIVLEGQTIFGKLISGKEYCDSMISAINGSGWEKDLIDQVNEFFEGAKEAHYAIDKTDGVPRYFLHLKEYGILKGDGFPLVIDDSFLRVPIDRVSAFALGKPDFKDD